MHRRAGSPDQHQEHAQATPPSGSLEPGDDLKACPAQLHLPIELLREHELADYCPGPNGEALAATTTLAQGTGESYLYLFGGPATGKTHLLQGACRAAIDAGRTAQYVPLGQSGLHPLILENLERRALLAIDDVQRIVGQPDWELALFDLFNRARHQGCRLLIAATAAPDDLGLGLPDLASRLQWGPRYCLLPLTDRDSELLIMRVAAGFGMRLGPETARYIMNNCARDPASLIAIVERIDRISLREQRQPSIPLVRRIVRGEA
ncbi:DnaA regulatory inactivator Hda [Thiocapsa imhoffii]|uniref:DnaA regulatory inactivator Hda n=1 Tax=Thiocapsa imhoffii TaxID=382777 RepID=A0A9X0WH21_9GAMM|nr:DnaA regulatory inactivator Hda [Thiocapsa imhoffii]MBK1644579.1 DnaA regulatory inactivator Hda [Thiocapsa imhoffii]